MILIALTAVFALLCVADAYCYTKFWKTRPKGLWAAVVFGTGFYAALKHHSATAEPK